MKKNALALITIIVLITALLGSVRVSENQNTLQHPPAGKRTLVYVMLEEENAVFDVALFDIELGNIHITETNKPILLYNGTAKEIHLKVEGGAVNWMGLKFKIEGQISLETAPGKTYLLTLELTHEPGVFKVKVDPSMTGVVGEELPKDILQPDCGFIEKALESINATGELQKNEELQKEYLELWKTTGNMSYLQAYRDLEYHGKVIALLAKLGRLNGIALKTHVLGLMATDYYYSHFKKPGYKDLVLVFSNLSPYYGAIKVTDGPLKSPLPFVYYRARGFNLYPVSALHWAQIYEIRGQKDVFLEILNDLRPFIEIKEYRGTRYALLPIYFHFQNSSIPWVSGYAQGLATGLYALAYNETGREEYLKLAEEFMNSFKLPLSKNGFIVQTEYGPWCLEYNYYPEQLVLNGNIICLQGVYYYWEVTGNETAHRLFLEGAQSVKRALPFFDTGNWSRYASIYNSSSLFYHRLHIKLLVWLYVKTGDDTFLRYAEKWNGYLKERGEKPENIERLIEEMRHSP